MTRKYQIGDGDPCPIDPEHGAMFFLRGTRVQYCSHQTHDGTPGRNGRPSTRSLWPQGHRSFAEAVSQRTVAPSPLPDLDIGELLNA